MTGQWLDAWRDRLDETRPRAERCAVRIRGRQLGFRNADLVARALDAYRIGRGDFADYLIREDAHLAGADVVVTFDKALLKDKGFRLP